MPTVGRIVVLLMVDIVALYTMIMMMQYLTNVWKLGFTNAALIVNIFWGAIAILPLFLTFIIESLTGSFWVLMISSIAHCTGLGFLAMSTPPVLANAMGTCSNYEPECIGQGQKILFYTGMSLVALGFSGHFISAGTFIATQFIGQEDNIDSGMIWRWVSGYLAVFVVTLAAVIALPFIKPWSIRFGILVICSLVATLLFLSGTCSYRYDKPNGSALTTYFRVFVAAASKLFYRIPKDAKTLHEIQDPEVYSVPHTRSLRCLDKAAIVIPTRPLEEQKKNKWRLCRVTEVESRRLGVVQKHGLVDKPDATVPMTMFWMVPQIMLLGAFTGVFYSSSISFCEDQFPVTQQAQLPVFILAVFGLGILGSSASVLVVGKVSERSGKRNWFQHDLNASRLDKYYLTLAWLMAINLAIFIVLAILYRYKEHESEDEEEGEFGGMDEPFEDNATCCCC